MDLAGSRIARCAKFLGIQGIFKDPGQNSVFDDAPFS